MKCLGPEPCLLTMQPSKLHMHMQMHKQQMCCCMYLRHKRCRAHRKQSRECTCNPRNSTGAQRLAQAHAYEAVQGLHMQFSPHTQLLALDCLVSFKPAIIACRSIEKHAEFIGCKRAKVKQGPSQNCRHHTDIKQVLGYLYKAGDVPKDVQRPHQQGQLQEARAVMPFKNLACIENISKEEVQLSKSSKSQHREEENRMSEQRYERKKSTGGSKQHVPM
eukprot:1134179-Pelagomonas_calceolata.AAC.3